MNCAQRTRDLRIEYDSDDDVLKIQGVRYAGELFRTFSLTPPNADEVFRIVNRTADGVVTIETVRSARLRHQFDLARAGRLA